VGERTLYVIAVVSNPVRFRARYALMKAFQQQFAGVTSAKLITVEMAFGAREFVCTERDNLQHVQVRGDTELWHKENLINVGIQYLSQLDPDWEYVAWVDADVTPAMGMQAWCAETIEQLQHYKIVQMFRHCIDMGPKHEILQTHNGFIWSYHQNDFMPPIGPGQGGYYGAGTKAFWHPGYAWAARREAIDALGGLIDWAILGSGDHHMAMAFIGLVLRSSHGELHPNYRKKLEIWQARSEKYIQRNLGYVDALLNHHFHGKKKDRRYVERWKVLVDNQYDPELDIKYDAQGLLTLTDNNWRLRDQIRVYMRQRNEDSIDLE
jgi:hypothetical protein